MENRVSVKKIIVSVLVAVSVTAIVIFGAMFFLQPGDTIAGGVYAGDVNLSGLTREDARIMLSANAPADIDSVTVYTKGGAKTEIYNDEIGFCCDIEKTLDVAFSKGREKNIFQNFPELIKLRLFPENIGYAYSYNKEKLAEAIYNFGVSVHGERKEYFLEYGENTVLAARGVGGQSKDVSQAIYALENAIGRGQRKIFIPLKKEDAQALNVKTLADAIYLEPKNAVYEITDGRIVITPDEPGRQVDMIDAATKMEALRMGETVEIKLVWHPAEITVADLDKNLFEHTLAQFTTTYSAKDKSRSANVALAARKINGVVLVPGEIFSYNDVVGPRTLAAGFKNAPVFENGQSVQGVGGGICQVSSTLYSAVLYADLNVVSRRNHSMTVAYVPKGQDATVVYGSIDFRFKNSTNHPIKILASAEGGKLSVSICGTKPETEKVVKIVNNIVSETEPGLEEVQDESVAVGEKKVISAGKTGYVVTTTRIVSENGVEVKRENMGTSKYKMVPAKVAIGKKVPEPLATLPPRTTPVPEESLEVTGGIEEPTTDTVEPEKTPVPTPQTPEDVPKTPVMEQENITNETL